MPSQQVTKNKSKLPVSIPRKVLIIGFVVLFAGIGFLMQRLSNAQATYDELDPATSNQQAFDALKANRAKHRLKTEKVKLPKKPANYRKYESGEIPPKVVPDKILPNAGGGTGASNLQTAPSPVAGLMNSIFPKAQADVYARSYAINRARQHMNTPGSVYMDYGVFPNEEWCANWISLLMKETGRSFWWGVGPSWRVNSVDRLGSGMYGVQALRAKGAYKPRVGDIVFFDVKADPYDWGNHVGIVSWVDNKGNINAIEGNTRNSNNRYSIVSENAYGWNDWKIVAYGTWLD